MIKQMHHVGLKVFLLKTFFGVYRLSVSAVCVWHSDALRSQNKSWSLSPPSLFLFSFLKAALCLRCSICWRRCEMFRIREWKTKEPWHPGTQNYPSFTNEVSKALMDGLEPYEHAHFLSPSLHRPVRACRFFSSAVKVSVGWPQVC